MQRTRVKKEKIAIIGGGIAGLGSAYFLYKDYDITIFEKNNYAGGHSYTTTVKEGKREIPIDTAVMIHNEANYPYLCRLLREIDAPTQLITSTIGIQHLPSGLEFAVPGLNRIFAQRKNLLNIPFYLLLKEILRFGSIAKEVLTDKRFASYTVVEYARERKFSDAFLDQYLLPITAALWSADQKLMRVFPIVTLVQYFDNHHILLPPLLDATGKERRYLWRGFVGGTKVYREKLLSRFPNALRLKTTVKSVRRFPKHVEVVTTKGEKFTFDKVILACHADESLALLSDPTPLETELLSHFYYKKNSVVLHTDKRVMPKNRKAWASFNSRVGVKENDDLYVEQHYYLNLLQNLPTKKDYFMAIGSHQYVDPKKILQKFTYSHPVYSLASAEAQIKLHKLNENGQTYFCGSYFRFAFHEDALVSALNVVRKITGKKIW